MKHLLDKFGAHGFTILAFPSNQFGAQATGDSACEAAYMYHKMNTTSGAFPIFDKTDVNGPAESEAFTFLKYGGNWASQPGWIPSSNDENDISWNYGKWLIGPSGIPVGRWTSGTDPLSFEADIARLLASSSSTASY
mmetsp:Transcript_17139/g.56076  ORF Transcript_17139/g.56076 Transcript_17139/m.56076 type:complete len:137 (+) Transcript_17139:254-664(+)